MRFLQTFGILAGLLFTACNVGATAVMNITSPTNSPHVTNPVHIAAHSTGEIPPISNMQVYDNGNMIYETPGPATSIDISQDLSSGTHTLMVKGWYNHGHNVSATINVTVDNQGVTYGNYQDATWNFCGDCGDNNGHGPMADYTVTKVHTPSESGNSLRFYIFNANGPYANGYAYVKNSHQPNTIKHLNYRFDLYVPQQYIHTPQAIEFECQQTINGVTYNFAWQADYASRKWRTFDYGLKRWIQTSLTFTPFSGDAWHHIEAVFHTKGRTIYFDSLKVDAKKTAFNNVSHQAVTTGKGAEFNNAFQLDTNGHGDAYKVFVDKMYVTVEHY